MYRPWGLLAVAICLVACHPGTSRTPASGGKLATGVRLTDTGCGPDFELNDSRYPPLLAAKKARLKADGYPADAVALLDKDGACVAAIERAPDIISLKTVNAAGDKSTMAWTQDDQRIADADLKADRIVAYYRFNVSRHFACCHEPAYDNRSDWNPDDEVNAAVVIRCVKSGAGVVCR